LDLGDREPCFCNLHATRGEQRLRKACSGDLGEGNRLHRRIPGQTCLHSVFDLVVASSSRGWGSRSSPCTSLDCVVLGGRACRATDGCETFLHIWVGREGTRHAGVGETVGEGDELAARLADSHHLHEAVQRVSGPANRLCWVCRNAHYAFFGESSPTSFPISSEAAFATANEPVVVIGRKGRYLSRSACKGCQGRATAPACKP
jgi:hypothetical protein